MICGMCNGTQSLWYMHNGKREWIDCPACNHWGFRVAGKGNGGIIDTEKEGNLK